MAVCQIRQSLQLAVVDWASRRRRLDLVRGDKSRLLCAGATLNLTALAGAVKSKKKVNEKAIELSPDAVIAVCRCPE